MNPLGNPTEACPRHRGCAGRFAHIKTRGGRLMLLYRCVEGYEWELLPLEREPR